LNILSEMRFSDPRRRHRVHTARQKNVVPNQSFGSPGGTIPHADQTPTGEANQLVPRQVGES